MSRAFSKSYESNNGTLVTGPVMGMEAMLDGDEVTRGQAAAWLWSKRHEGMVLATGGVDYCDHCGDDQCHGGCLDENEREAC